MDGSVYQLSVGDDSDAEVYAQIGKTMTLRDLCEAMITVSSNFAANLLIERVGADNVRKTVTRLGADGMVVLRGVEDQKAFDKGMNNATTARGARRAAAEDRAGTGGQRRAPTRRWSRSSKRQKFHDAIPAGLPDGTVVAHKTGNITKIHHDAAIVYGPRPYVLVVLVRGIEDQKVSGALIASISREIWNGCRSRPAMTRAVRSAGVRGRARRAGEAVEKDRSILAAILCGSLSHDTVWARSDIDLVLVTIDDKKIAASDIPLYADGVNVHALLIPRTEFRRMVEGSLHGSFIHSFLAKGRLLYTHDPTISDLFGRLRVARPARHGDPDAARRDGRAAVALQGAQVARDARRYRLHVALDTHDRRRRRAHGGHRRGPAARPRGRAAGGRHSTRRCSRRSTRISCATARRKRRS